VRTRSISDHQTPLPRPLKGVINTPPPFFSYKGCMQRNARAVDTPLVTVDTNTTAEDALRTMVNNNVGRLLITENGEHVGIFTTSDVTKLVP